MAAALCAVGEPAGALTFDFEVVFQTGDDVPGVPGTTFSGFVPGPINDQGETVLNASVTGPSGTNPAPRFLGTAGSGGTFALQLRPGDPAPGIAGATVTGFSRAQDIDNAGQIAFLAGLDGQGIDQTNNTVLYVQTASGLEPVLRTGATIPGQPPEITVADLGTPIINDAGDLVVTVEIDAPGVTDDNDDVVLRQTATGFEIAAREGFPVSGLPGAATERIFGTPGLDEDGTIILNTRLQTAGPPTGSSGGLIAIGETGSTVLAQQGVTQVPDAGGAIIESVGISAPERNATGEFVLPTSLSVGTGDATDDNARVLIASRNGGIETVIREGDTILGAGDGQYSRTNSGEAGISDAGVVVARSFLEGPGVDSSNNVVLWADGNNGPEKILRTGDMFELAPGDFRQISSISVASAGRFVNASTQVGFVLGLGDLALGAENITTVLVLATPIPVAAIPLPAGVWLLAAALALLWRRSVGASALCLHLAVIGAVPGAPMHAGRNRHV
ncbi:MAG: choice-of-anchor tandem repeat NxxGxxAF-containing protein [Pseudomonadota bacterium]